MGFNDVIHNFKEDLAHVEQALRDNYWSDVSVVSAIGDYILKGGGKRIRPLLMLMSARLCGLERNEALVRHCCAVEYIHTATLLHDDVVDETTVRRGRDTVNSKWGNDASILVGDFLIARAISLLAKDINSNVFRAFGRAAETLVEGGLKEFSSARDLLIPEEHCIDVVYRKTASIMSLSCQVGAQLAGAPPELEKALTAFGDNFGIAFQLVDDIMDYDANPESLGKPVGTDFKEGHVTLPLLHLYQRGDRALKREIEQFVENENLGNKELDYILERMREHKVFDYSMNKVQSYMAEAMRALSDATFPAPQYTDTFQGVTDYIMNRYQPAKPTLTPIS